MLYYWTIPKSQGGGEEDAKQVGYRVRCLVLGTSALSLAGCEAVNKVHNLSELHCPSLWKGNSR